MKPSKADALKIALAALTAAEPNTAAADVEEDAAEGGCVCPCCGKACDCHDPESADEDAAEPGEE